ncbi:hypothetical protein ACHHYP_02702 [Achlya hypogyna]|uniref:Uncharacterized protein n=1 Tax=Achlya hypogyna TaxID=1202772 RepID=A0A1V9ZS12_ACHHY|nr:hypothetical protein ACHHYP_02702 [Achlya hypogyna]
MMDARPRRSLPAERRHHFHHVPGGFQSRYNPSRDYLRASVSSQAQSTATDEAVTRSMTPALGRPVLPKTQWPAMWHKLCDALRLPRKTR